MYCKILELLNRANCSLEKIPFEKLTVTSLVSSQKTLSWLLYPPDARILFLISLFFYLVKSGKTSFYAILPLPVRYPFLDNEVHGQR